MTLHMGTDKLQQSLDPSNNLIQLAVLRVHKQIDKNKSKINRIEVAWEMSRMGTNRDPLTCARSTQATSSACPIDRPKYAPVMDSRGGGVLQQRRRPTAAARLGFIPCSEPNIRQEAA